MEENQSILHELYVFCEWKPEPEYIQKPDSILPENISTLWRWITFFGPKKSLIDSVTAHKERQQKWHIALGDEGKVIAVLTDNILEIRTKRSDYATIAARTTVSRDAYPQWRKVVWSPDCAFLAVAFGNGIVSFFDLTASNLFNIPADCSRPGGLECTDNTHAVADIIFMPLRVKDTKWNWEVLIVTFDGKLRGYLVSNMDGFKLHHTFSFAGGVAALTYSQHHDSLIVAGLPRGPCKDPSSPLYAGITAWRILNDDPFYKLSVVSDELEAQLVNNTFQMYIPFVSAKNLAFIINMVISPDGNHLVCVYCNGDVTIWRLPLLKLVNRFPLLQQPEYDFQPDDEDEEKSKNKDVMVFSPADVQWWDNQAIIISRFTGAVSVCELVGLQNLLVAPVSLRGAPRLSATHDNAFLALECDSHTLPQRRNDSNGSELIPADLEVEDTMFELTKELFKSVLFAITDMETFQPRPKKITVVSRTYRLLGIKSTTPDELYNRKIDSGNYKEALELSERFSLDSDLVYQQQWRKTPVSSEAINKYLSKVSKKIWAVHQCVDRLPETLPAAKELLKFGLQLTNDEILNEVNKEKDVKLSSPEDISLEDLNAYTSELLRCRHVMLFNKERLKLYEAILKTEKSTFTKEEYDRLCSNSIVHSAIELAKEGRVSALVCLWPHISSVKMQLTVLENLPETIDPVVYEKLLPGIDGNGEIVMKITNKTVDKSKDWCRNEKFRSIWNTTWSEDSTPESEVQAQPVTADDITKWYDKRARQIEQYSGIITHSIALLNIASEECNVPGLKHTLFHLNTLYTLMYQLYIDDVTLKQVEKLTPLDTCKMLTSKSTTDSFMSDINEHVTPYLKRYEEMHEMTDFSMTGLIDFLESISVNDLLPILTLLQSRSEFSVDVRTRIVVAERCLFSYKGTEQFNVACDIVTAVLDESDGTIPPTELLHRQKRMERVIAACGIVWARHVDISLAELRDMRDHVTAATKTLRRIANTSVDEKPNQQDWEKLLKDLLDLQSILFTCVPKEDCYEIYASALLRSGDASSIKLASEALTCDKSDTNKSHLVPYEKSVTLVINAATEYFNSSSSLSDPALELARYCLKLIKDENQVISDELDLIEAMTILDSFQLPVLPIQVRICEDRMEFIEQCLKENPSAIHATHKLLNLAKLLRICPNDELQREGLVLLSVCGRSERSGGAGAVRGGAARRLASLRLYPPAPTHLHTDHNQKTYCELLTSTANDPQVPLDRNARRDLLTAAATYCTPDALEKILKSRLSLELEGIQQSGAALRDGVLDHCPSTEDEFADAVTTPVIEKKDIVEPSHNETKLPLLKHLLDSVQSRLHWSEDRTEKSSERIPRIHVIELYRSIYPEHLISRDQFSYSQFTAPTSEISAHTLGQTALSWFYVHNSLADTNYYSSLGHFESKVLTRCAEEMIYTDTPLAVSCILQGGKICPSSPASIITQMYATLIQSNADKFKDDVYFTKPRHLATTALTQNTATKQQLDLIGLCLDKLIAIAEVDTLHKYGCSVNLALYNADNDYKKEIVYRLARSSTKQHKDFAWSLARKYDIDTCDLWVQHASTVLTDTDAVKKLTIDGMLDDNHDRGKLADRLKNELWDQVPGSDHNSLINYFTILKMVDDKIPVYGLTPNDHIKLLKKAKAACSELNYKLLLIQPSREAFLSHILEIIKPENVGMLTKFLRALPQQQFKIPITINTLYTAWLTKYFFTVSQSAASNKKWMQQYRQCASYFNKLSQNDLLEFVTNTCFSNEAIERVPDGTRNLMIMQAVDYCQQEQENDIKMNKNFSEWEQVGQELSRWARFLENFHSPAVQGIVNNINAAKKDVWIGIEKSRGSVEGLVPCLSALVMEQELSPAVMTSLLRGLQVEVDPTTIFTWITQHMLENPLDVQIVISRVTLYYKEGTKFPDDLIETIMQKATEYGLPPHKQIGLLSLSNKNQIQDNADLQKIAQFTVDLLNTEWEGVDVQEINEELLLSEEGRRSTFKRLLDKTDTWQRKKALVDVLNCWPTTGNSENMSLQCEYLKYLLKIDEQKEALVLIKLLLRRPVLVEKEINMLIETSPAEVVLNMIWIILLSKIDNCIKLIPKLAIQHKETLRNSELEDDLIKELLDSGLFLKLVSTPLYSHIVNYLLSKQMQPEDINDKYTISWATKELMKANLIAETGQLHLMTIGVPSPLRGFSDTVKYCMNYLNQE